MMVMVILLMMMRLSGGNTIPPSILSNNHFLCCIHVKCRSAAWKSQLLRLMMAAEGTVFQLEFANFRPGSDRRQVRRKDGKSVRTFATNWVDICFKYRKHRKAVPNFTSDYKGGEIQLLSSALWERTMCTTWVQQRARTKKLWHREETDSWTRLASAWAFHHVHTVDDVLCWTSI